MTPPDRLRSLEIHNLTHNDLFTLVNETQSLADLRFIAGVRFEQEARVMNDIEKSPFILWPPINKEPQPWLALLTAKVTRLSLGNQLDDVTTIIAIPNSATWYTDYLRLVFPNAHYPRIMKDKTLPIGQDTSNAIPLDVPSYVHGRREDGSRQTERMWFFDSQQYVSQGKILIVDDALAEGVTGIKVADFARQSLRQQEVYYATPMAKSVQGGELALTQSGLFNGISILVRVTKTNGKGNPMEFTC